MKIPAVPPPAERLTVDEAARLLNRHPEQVRRYLREGRLPGALKLGLMWFIPRKDVLALAACLRDKGRQAPIIRKGAA